MPRAWRVACQSVRGLCVCVVQCDLVRTCERAKGSREALCAEGAL